MDRRLQDSALHWKSGYFGASRNGLGPVYRLELPYYEPVTDIDAADSTSLIGEDGFFLKFSPKLMLTKLEPTMIPPLLKKIREICET